VLPTRGAPRVTGGDSDWRPEAAGGGSKSSARSRIHGPAGTPRNGVSVSVSGPRPPPLKSSGPWVVEVAGWQGRRPAAVEEVTVLLPQEPRSGPPPPIQAPG
jgi:hypothetical protein